LIFFLFLKKIKMQCASRVVNNTYSQKFGDNHHIFYVEQRCTTMSNSSVCILCSTKTDTKTQTSRKFNHGTINEPLPDNSHIYGSKWYNNIVKKYQTPSADIIEFAEKYQRTARMGSVVTVVPETVVPLVPETVVPVTVVPIVPETLVTETFVPEVPVAPKKRVRKKKPVICDTLIKEVSLPTHIEKTLEEVETYNIEYIKLHQIEHNGTTYFKDNKNKLYRKIKDDIGPYVGRLDKNSIIDIPDSDNEN